MCRYARFRQSLFMDLWDNQEDYDGNHLHYKQYRKLLKHILFICLKTRMSLSDRVCADALEICVPFMRNVLQSCNVICILLDVFGMERSGRLFFASKDCFFSFSRYG